MEPEDLKIIIVGIFVAAIAVYFSMQDNFEVILITITIATLIFAFGYKGVWKMEGV